MKFEKVSLDQWFEACRNCGISYAPDEIRVAYDNIQLPTRSTKNSAGYDFIFPFKDYNLTPSKYIVVPTGIRWCGENCDGKFLMLVPRSGLGFKKGLKLRNTAGIIDADYQFANNEGHIMAKIGVEEPLLLETSKAFMQGIIMQYFVVDDEEEVVNERVGGFGSTER